MGEGGWVRRLAFPFPFFLHFPRPCMREAAFAPPDTQCPLPLRACWLLTSLSGAFFRLRPMQTPYLICTSFHRPGVARRYGSSGWPYAHRSRVVANVARTISRFRRGDVALRALLPH